MNNFVKVTSKEGREIYVNSLQIKSIFKDSGDGAYIYFVNEEGYYRVVESPETIILLLNIS